MEKGLKLSLHYVADLFDVTLYQQTIGCLIYVCITRSNIQFAVSQVSKVMHSPQSKHWHAIKWIFCYLHGTIHLGLFYPKGGSLSPDLHAFFDSDWASCYDTRVHQWFLFHAWQLMHIMVEQEAVYYGHF